jgi:hypothetical protein
MELYKNHRENALKAQKLAIIAASKKKESIRKEYELNPNKCIQCDSPLDFRKRDKPFCSSSCAAKYNNKKRGPRSEQTKYKIAKTLSKNNIVKDKINKRTNLNKEKYNLNPKRCKICNSILPYEYRHRKTCSKECNIIACVKIRDYQNGSRKNIWYFNKNENKNVLLESSWEYKFAEFLDSNNIFWLRPKHIIWFDKNGKKRYYFPDFYLPKFDIYIDPKNPYCLEKDSEKLEIIQKQVNIIYGEINQIIDILQKKVLV